MSETEYHFGKALEVCNFFTKFEDKLLFAKTNLGFIPHDDDEIGYLNDPNFIYLKKSNQLFKILSREKNNYEINTMLFDDFDKVFTFYLSFYNGACSFDEAFEDMYNAHEERRVK